MLKTDQNVRAKYRREELDWGAIKKEDLLSAIFWERTTSASSSSFIASTRMLSALKWKRTFANWSMNALEHALRF